DESKHVPFVQIGVVGEAVNEYEEKDYFDDELGLLNSPQFRPATSIDLAPHILRNEAEEIPCGRAVLLLLMCHAALLVLSDCSAELVTDVNRRLHSELGCW